MKDMKKLIFVLLLLASPAFANLFCVRVNAASNNIPTAFSTGAASLVLQGVRQPTAVFVENRTTSEIAINCSASATSAPAATGSNVLYVNASNAWAIDSTYLTGNCYIESNTGSAITTGVVQICLSGS